MRWSRRRLLLTLASALAGGAAVAGYDDPRFLQARIEALQRELNDLRRRAVPLLAHQPGPVAGRFNAAQIGPGAAARSAMHLNMDGNQPGVAPRMSVTDPNGKVRVEIGNLGAYSGPNTSSPAQYGIRIINANADVLVDDQNLATPIVPVGGSNFGTDSGATLATWSTTNPVTFTGPLTGTSLTIGPFVQGGTVIAVGTLVAKVSAGTGLCYAVIGVDGAVGFTNVIPGWQNGAPYLPGTSFGVFNLGAGSHTFGWFGSTDSNTITGACTAQSIQLYSIGAPLF